MSARPDPLRSESVHPDLLMPLLPDADDLHATPRSTSLRVDHTEVEWPEAGPSSLPMGSQGLSGGLPDATAPKIGPFGAKVIAAMTGATATSLLMTPFDVLKTRLQTVRPTSSTVSRPFPSFAPAVSSSLARSSSECCQTSVFTPIAANSKRFGSGGVGKSKTPLPSSNPLTCFSSSASSVDDLPPPRSTTRSTAAVGAGAGRGGRATFSSLTVPAEAPRGCAAPSKWAGIWGEAVSFEEALSRSVRGDGGTLRLAGAGLGGEAGTAGLATLVLPHQPPAAKSGFWGEIAAVRAEVGIRGLWKGAGTALTMGIPSSAIYMIGYEHLLTRISPYFTSSTDPNAHISSIHRKPGTTAGSATASLTAAPLVAGSLARTISATAISPIEMFRTRLQALPVAGVSPSYGSVFQEMSALVRAQGITVLWRGLGPTLWRDVPFSGIYWAGFEIFKTKLSSSSSPLPPLHPLTISFLSGATSGIISALFTQPFDVLKTRRQVFTPSKTCDPAALRHRASTLPLALHVIRTEGWQALFAGTVPRCGKVAPACGLMIACYEGVGRYLGAGSS